MRYWRTRSRAIGPRLRQYPHAIERHVAASSPGSSAQGADTCPAFPHLFPCPSGCPEEAQAVGMACLSATTVVTEVDSPECTRMRKQGLRNPAEVSRRPDATLRFRRNTRLGTACASTPGTELNDARAGQAGRA